MRENIRSGRKANFYITENSFIDHYAKAVGPMCAVVYNVLERYMNSETRSTWVGTARIAEVVGATQRTVQRNLKTLEEFKLIRILKTASATTYVVLPVPARPKEATIPLFDAVDDQDILWRGDTSVAEATQASFIATEPSHYTTAASQARDTGDTPNKEEQDLLNKTAEQGDPQINVCVERIMKIYKLPSALRTAVATVVKAEVRHKATSPDMVVFSISQEIARLKGKGTPIEDFFSNFLARICAQSMVGSLNLNASNPALTSTIAEAIKAEARHSRLTVEEASAYIVSEASKDMDRGVAVNKFYFDDMKWRKRNGRPKQTSQERLQQELDILRAHLG